MGEEKRFILFLILTMLIVVLTPPLWNWVAGPAPKAQLDQDAQLDAPVIDAKVADPSEPANNDEMIAKTDDAAQVREPVAGPVQPAPDQPAPNQPAPNQPAPDQPEPDPATSTLGSVDAEEGYLMKVELTNHGAAVRRIELANFDDEMHAGKLQLLSTQTGEEGSFVMDLKGHEPMLAERNWTVLPEDPDDAQIGLQRVRYETHLGDSGLVVTKTFTLAKNSYTLGLEVDIKNASDRDTSLVYRLGGPRGFVLEGAWYATKKRDVAIGTDSKRNTVRAPELVKGAKKIFDLADATGSIPQDRWAPLLPDWFDRFDIDHDHRLTGSEVNDAAVHLASAERYTEHPVRFAGVDGQFFCALMVLPPARSAQDRVDAATLPVLNLTTEELMQLKEAQKSSGFLFSAPLIKHADRCDVSVEIESNRFDLPAGGSIHHAFTLYAGPRKKDELIHALNDTAIADSVMNYTGVLIFPRQLVGFTASTMLFILQFFHRGVGNWGVAIIMLTVMVRLLMFPLSRKQALSAVKMQQLKPQLDALKEKYKNDKEKFSRAQMELWRKHNVNPLGGCLPLVVQMPIFIGLWQGLQSSVDLRHAKFLWIDNLAAPDGPSVKFFHWGDNVPFISSLFGPYFNLLPAILIGLFLIQQKMFLPPKTATPDPQVEMQQKMMTFMMVFFGYIFWRLPSGLCLYYIASTLWGITERKLLPKLQQADTSAASGSGDAGDTVERKPRGPDRDGKGNGRDPRDRRPPERRPPSLAEKFHEFIKKAEKR